MTEQETMQRAKIYLDKLANGIDPLTDLPVPKGDVVNQVRISRCLFYVSDVLRRVMDNGGISLAGKKEKKLPFSITREQLDQVRFSKAPLRITELCQRITDAAGQENMTRMSPVHILNWLESIGMLAMKMDEKGERRRRPTQAGMQIGIQEAQRNGMHGSYVAVLYDENAQHFIVDNLEAVPNLKK